MRVVALGLGAALGVASVALWAIYPGGPPSDVVVASAGASAPAISAPVPAAAPVSAARFVEAVDYARDRFTADSARVDNRFLPMPPGTQHVYDGVVTEDGEAHRHRIVTTFTGLSKVIDGVRTRVLLDQDYSDGVLAEEEIAFFAQDAEGVVWGMGEYPEEYEDGKFKAAPSVWLAGVEESRAGIAMPARIEAGMPAYSQGLAPAVEFDDRGQVTDVAVTVEDRLGSYAGGILVRETSASQPGDGFQIKHHAPGVGVVRIQADGGNSRETLQRSATRVLAAEELQAIDALARTLDTRAYDVAPGVWTGTAPVDGASSAIAPSDAPSPCVRFGRGFARLGC